MKRRYGKRYCKFCQEYITKNPMGWFSHNQKHVREGIAVQIRGQYPKRAKFVWASDEEAIRVAKKGYAEAIKEG